MGKSFKEKLAGFMCLVLLCTYSFAFSAIPVFAAGTVYYVSYSAGNDNNDGLSSSTPWKTLAKASRAYAAGDSLLLKCGDTWTEQLHPTGDGTSTNPITIGSYGSGNRPVINRGDENNQSYYGIYITDNAGYHITGIEICNAYRGIVATYGANISGKNYMYVDNCYFHNMNICGNGYWSVGIYH